MNRRSVLKAIALSPIMILSLRRGGATAAVGEPPPVKKLGGFIVNKFLGDPSPKDSVMAKFSAYIQSEKRPLDKITNPLDMPILWCPEEVTKKIEKSLQKKGEGKGEGKKDKDADQMSILDYIHRNSFRGSFEEFLKQEQARYIPPISPLASWHDTARWSELLGQTAHFHNRMDTSFYNPKTNNSIYMTLFTLDGRLLNLKRQYLDIPQGNNFSFKIGIGPENVINVLMDLSVNATNLFGNLPDGLSPDDLAQGILTRRQIGDYLVQVRQVATHPLGSCTKKPVTHFNVDIQAEIPGRKGRYRNVYDFHFGFTYTNRKLCFVFYNSRENPLCCYMCNVNKVVVSTFLFGLLIAIAEFQINEFMASMLSQLIADYIVQQYGFINETLKSFDKSNNNTPQP